MTNNLHANTAGWNKKIDDLKKDGAESGTRTHDLLITNQLLYQLSYFGIILLYRKISITRRVFIMTAGQNL